MNHGGAALGSATLAFVLVLAAATARPATGQEAPEIAPAPAARGAGEQAATIPGAADPAATAEAEPQGLADIVVTAERRSTNLQRTALAVSAVTGDDLLSRQVTSVESLAQTLPNVNFGALNGDARIAIRGVGFDNINIGNEPRIAFHADGVYVARPSGALANFFDLERVEIVRGPQGTLYGRNATGGAVNVITRDPDDAFGGYASVTAGNFDTLSAEAALNVPLADAVAIRIAGLTTHHSGYSRNVITGSRVDDQHLSSLRGKIRFDFTPAIRWTVIADYVTQDDKSGARHFFGEGSRVVPPATAPFVRLAGLRFGGTYASNDRDVATDVDPQYRRENHSFTSVLAIELPFADLASITGYRNTFFTLRYDLDGSSTPLTNAIISEKSETFSQELRLSNSYEWGDWLLGGYYFDEDLSGATQSSLDIRLFAPPGAPRRVVQGLFVGGDLKTEAYAIFGQLRVNVGSRLALVAGGRYSNEEKTISEIAQLDLARAFDPRNPVVPRAVNGTQVDTDSASAFTPRLTVEYRPTDRVFAYATYAEGFKAGGYNLGGIQPPFKPEKLVDYEVGIKTDFFDRRLRTNLSAFYYDYTDLQVSKVTGAVISIENAANATVKGVEAEIVALPTDALRLELTGAWLDATYADFFSIDPANPTLGAPLPGSPPGSPPQQDVSGNRLTQAPQYTLGAAVEYRLDLGGGEVTIRGEHNRSDKIFFSQFNVDPVSQRGYGISNAFIRYRLPNGATTVSAFIKNIEDHDIKTSAAVTSVLFGGGAVVGNLQPPRTYGVQLTTGF